MRPSLALFAPDCAIERRKRQTRTQIYRPEDGDPTHRLTATSFDLECVSISPSSTEIEERSCQTTVLIVRLDFT